MLPEWAISDDEAANQDAAFYASMSPSEKAALLGMLCRDAVRIARSRPDADRVFAYEEPIPEDSQVLLARLRSAYRASRHG